MYFQIIFTDITQSTNSAQLVSGWSLDTNTSTHLLVTTDLACPFEAEDPTTTIGLGLFLKSACFSCFAKAANEPVSLGLAWFSALARGVTLYLGKLPEQADRR